MANGQMIRIPASFSCALVQRLADSIRKAVTFLEIRLPSITYSYAVAMTSYALANEKKLNRNKLFQYISEGNIYTSILILYKKQHLCLTICKKKKKKKKEEAQTCMVGQHIIVEKYCQPM